MLKITAYKIANDFDWERDQAERQHSLSNDRYYIVETYADGSQEDVSDGYSSPEQALSDAQANLQNLFPNVISVDIVEIFNKDEHNEDRELAENVWGQGEDKSMQMPPQAMQMPPQPMQMPY